MKLPFLNHLRPGADAGRLESRFAEVWRGRMWLSEESASGQGSERGSGAVVHSLSLLDRMIRELGVRSIADLPCGDFNWMPLLLERHPRLRYVGYDVVGELIAENRRRFPGVRFEQLDVTRRRPRRADLVFSKDMLNHLSEADVWSALENMAGSGARWLMLTTNQGFENVELQAGVPHASRHLNLEAAPYSLTGAVHRDHYLLVFRAQDVARRVREHRAAPA